MRQGLRLQLAELRVRLDQLLGGPGELLGESQHTLRGRQIRQHLHRRQHGRGDVSARPADRRDDVLGEPVLEALGGGEVAPHHEPVDAGLGDDDRVLFARGGTDSVEAALGLGGVPGDVAGRVGVAEEPGDVPSDEPGFAVDGHGPDRGAGLRERVGDNGHGVHLSGFCDRGGASGPSAGYDRVGARPMCGVDQAATGRRPLRRGSGRRSTGFSSALDLESAASHPST